MQREAEQATALITGINGQDGSYLADFLLAKNYRVIGTVRPESRNKLARIAHLSSRIETVELDLKDQVAMRDILERYEPTEIYNLAARASSSQLHSDPVLAAECNGVAVVRLLEATRAVNPGIRFCQASSSEMFGNTLRSPQNEETEFRPRNSYGAAKLLGHWTTSNYRDEFGLFACSAILFNHESPRRGLEFVTRKVSRGAAMIKAGRQSKLELGNLHARRDWGFAGDYVRAMWLMVQAPAAGDYVIASGETHSVEELCDIAFRRVGLDYSRFVVDNTSNKRGPEITQLVGDASKAREVLGWRPSLSFVSLIEMMVDADVREIADLC